MKPRHSLMLAAAIAVFASNATIAEIRFFPRILLEAGYIDDVSYGVSTASGVDLSDRVSRITVELPVERVTRNGSLRFLVRPGYEKYADFEDLDEFRHRTQLEGERVGERTTSGFAISFERSQGQIDPGTEPTAELFVSPRADRDHLSATGRLERSFGRRWLGRANASFSDFSFEPVEASGFPSPATVATSDRDQLDISLSFARKAKRGGSLGFEIGVTDFSFESGDRDDVDAVALVWDGVIGRRDRLIARLGAFQSDRTPATGPRTENDGLLVGMLWERSSRNAAWSVDLSRRPEAATSQINESSATSTVVLGVTSRDTTRWFADASLDLARREADSRPDLDRVAVSGSVERRFESGHGLRLNALHYDQTDDVDPVLDAAYFSASLTWVWYPRGIPR